MMDHRARDRRRADPRLLRAVLASVERPSATATATTAVVEIIRLLLSLGCGRILEEGGYFSQGGATHPAIGAKKRQPARGKPSRRR
jgi:hypothetical protein